MTMPRGLPDWTKGVAISVEAKLPEISLTKYAAYTKSEVYGKRVTLTAAGEVTATFPSDLVGGKKLNCVAVATNIADDGDYFYVRIRDAEDNIVGEPIDSTNPNYFYGDDEVLFEREWPIPEGGKVEVICYGVRAKSFFPAIEVLS